MATTKALLKEAIGTVGAHAAIPSYNGITIVPTTTEPEKYMEVARGIAPCDGQIELFATATDATLNSIDGNIGGRKTIPRETQVSGWGTGLQLLVAKGQAYYIRARDVKDISIVLYKSIGGG